MPNSDQELRLRHVLFTFDIYNICQEFAGSVTGGGRTHERNSAVGGHPNSWHLWDRGALAVDLAFDNDWERDLAHDRLVELGYQVIGPYPSDHLHVEPST